MSTRGPTPALPFVACSLIAMVGAALAAGVPDLISFQGRLLDADGDPVTTVTQVRFRLYRGGDATTVPAAGVLTYHEIATVSPGLSGVFSHFIGDGAAQDDCAAGPCLLGSAAVGDGSSPVWIEMTVDPWHEATPGYFQPDGKSNSARVCGTMAPWTTKWASRSSSRSPWSPSGAPSTQAR